jgi:hypothetical protein
LFAQFGHTHYAPADNETKRINRFRCYEVEAFKLRSMLIKRGYIRGRTQDGGTFYWYERPLVSKGIRAVVQFSGNRLPEDNVPVALTSLYFRAIASDMASADGADMLLCDVPPVLLAECYHDLATVAAAGNGRQLKWEQQLGD